ncbi:MAG: N-acetylneuraminate synthase family protein [Ilumatobacteraceae bacterium]
MAEVSNVPRVDVVRVGSTEIGNGKPVFVIAEIGINHNGDVGTAKKLIDVATAAGCDAVKFQKRTPAICVPPEQASILRETPWGTMTYLEYKERIEFGTDEFSEIDAHCRAKNIMWFASPWDVPSVEFLESFNTPVFKIASACLTDDELLGAIRATGKPVIMSTGMSTLAEIDHATSLLDRANLILGQATSTYPCKPEELNLRAIQSLRERYGVPVGYSGHETGLQTTIAAVALGAVFVERHITLDRAMWGTDHAASVEPGGLERLVRDIRLVEQSLGDGKKTVYETEIAIRKKLRRISSQ